MLLVLLALGFMLLAALITLPTSRSGGPGRIAAFAVLSIVGAAGALLLDHSGVLPTLGMDTAKAEKARDLMIADLETQAQVKVVEAPSVEAIADTDAPAIWRLEEGLTLLCAASDFPDSAEMACFAPAVLIAEGVDTDAAVTLDESDADAAH